VLLLWAANISLQQEHFKAARGAILPRFPTIGKDTIESDTALQEGHSGLAARLPGLLLGSTRCQHYWMVRRERQTNEGGELTVKTLSRLDVAPTKTLHN
jgi:hypothetical protein